MQTPFGTGTETPGGITSKVPTDFGGTHSMAEEFNLRKQQRRGTETEESRHPRSKSSSIPVLGLEQRGSKRKAVGDVEVSVDVDALEREDGLSKGEVRKSYEAQKSAGLGGVVDQEDLSQMIAEESAKRRKRDEGRSGKGGGGRR
ncbi:hypothetical protein LTR59_010973 [Friedmanniomyces endolithicus]|nr:hypothetical protein LTR59_010973 [Friedmanniomyces endolithicus]